VSECTQQQNKGRVCTRPRRMQMACHGGPTAYPSDAYALGVEAASNVSSQFHVLILVFTDRDQRRAIEQYISSHQDRVGQQPRPYRLPLRKLRHTVGEVSTLRCLNPPVCISGFVFELCHPGQPAQRCGAAQQPLQLSVLAYVGPARSAAGYRCCSSRRWLLRGRLHWPAAAWGAHCTKMVERPGSRPHAR
jgi:hypothetical protein